jgi:hypothetical protein
MKIRSVVAIVGLAISFAMPIFAQEKEEPTPFLYRAIPASPQIAQRLNQLQELHILPEHRAESDPDSDRETKPFG